MLSKQIIDPRRVISGFVQKFHLFDSLRELHHVICSSYHRMPVDQGDECGSLADFNGPTLAVKYSFSNFSFKVISALPILF